MLCFAHLLHGSRYSFPTRRSSDLEGETAVGNARPALRSGGRGDHVRPRGGEVVEALRRADGRDRHVRRCAEDRKSTRLNSSHRCISYAVFCLKKKKTTSKCSGTKT